MDSTAIATALAARYAAAQMSAPAGFRAIRTSTYKPAEDVPPLPCVMVFPPTAGTFESGNGTRTGGHDWTVRFLYDQAGDLARQGAALLKWLDKLTDQLRASVTLGGAVVTATTTGYQIGFFGYADKKYAGIELTVHIVTSESWAAAA
jgi:hypothetical protein